MNSIKRGKEKEKGKKKKEEGENRAQG